MLNGPKRRVRFGQKLARHADAVFNLLKIAVEFFRFKRTLRLDEIFVRRKQEIHAEFRV